MGHHQLRLLKVATYKPICSTDFTNAFTKTNMSSGCSSTKLMKMDLENSIVTSDPPWTFTVVSKTRSNWVIVIAAIVKVNTDSWHRLCRQPLVLPTLTLSPTIGQPRWWNTTIKAIQCTTITIMRTSWIEYASAERSWPPTIANQSHRSSKGIRRED